MLFEFRFLVLDKTLESKVRTHICLSVNVLLRTNIDFKMAGKSCIHLAKITNAFPSQN